MTTNFELNDDQRAIQATARSLLAFHASLEAVRDAADAGTVDQTLWAEMCDLGWPGIAVDEDFGGSGLAMIDACLLLEEQGAALAPTPLLPTICVALALQAAGSDDQRERWLPGLATGERSGAIASQLRDGTILVLGGADAEVVVVLDADQGFVADMNDVHLRPAQTLDLLRPYGVVDRCGDAFTGDAGRAFGLVCTALAAEMTGVCQRSLDATVAYVKHRKQFGVPVGTFQAVSHRCVDMLFDTESARSATYYAALVADAEPDSFADAAAVAKYVSSGAAPRVTAHAIQAHGGVGFTWEAALHLWLRRAQVSAQVFGSAKTHAEQLGASLLAKVREPVGR